MSDILSQLNPEQALAVKTVRGPVLVLAGAGSGKTRVLTYRTAYLVRECGVAPWNILAITFTNKAAAEMKTRIEDLIGSSAEDMWVKTFHSMCVRILRRDIDKLGISQSFVIYDSDDQKKLIKEVLKELNFSDKEYPPQAVLSCISGAKDMVMDPEEYEAIYSGNYRMKNIARIYSLYQKKLTQNNALDFDDLISYTVKLFEKCPEVLAFYRKKFLYIHIDEYQDTNSAQYRLVKLLSDEHRNICAVGDDDQSIYGFRGADIRNILEFEKDFPDATVIKLEQNYRSTQNILSAANEVIKNNKGRHDKKLWTAKQGGDKIESYTALDERDEASFIALKMHALNKKGIKYSDMAVLYRMNAQSRVLEESFMRAALPYRILAGHRFYDRKEIKDVIAYLKVLENPSDNLSLVRIINEPKRKIGDVSVGNAMAKAGELGISLFELISNPEYTDYLGKAKVQMSQFGRMMKSLADKKEELSVSELIKLTMENSGYLAQYTLNPDVDENRTRAENVREFISGALSYEQENEGATLGEFLDNVSLVSDADGYDGEVDAAVMMTLHTAKGLEFPVVFLCGMEEGIFPSMRSADTNEGIEEERRLCYVGITRAKEELFITNCRQRLFQGSTVYARPSRFVSEIPDELLKVNSAQNSFKTNVNTSAPKSAGFTGYQVKAEPSYSGESYSRGERVLHKKFGEGTILSAVPVGNDIKLEIAFDNHGTKILLGVYANLKKI